MAKRVFILIIPALFVFLIFSSPIQAYRKQPFRDGGFRIGAETVFGSQNFEFFGALFDSGLDPEITDNFSVEPTNAEFYQLGYIIPGGSVDMAFELDVGLVRGGDFVEITGTDEKPPLGDLKMFGGGVLWLMGAEAEAPMESAGSMQYVKPVFYYVQHDQGEDWAYGMAGGYYFSVADSNSWGLCLEISAIKFGDYWLNNLGGYLYFW